MTKKRTSFCCDLFGYEAPKWYGKCPQCGEWNSLREQTIKQKTNFGNMTKAGSGDLPRPIMDVRNREEGRQTTGSGELDRALGGGVVSGSITLIAGSPGVGKSTLLLQISDNVSQQRGKVLYISGEESPGQIRLRANRLNVQSPDLFIGSETDIDHICEQIEKIKPVLVVVDSIQTVHDPSLKNQPGSITQVRQCCRILMKHAKDLNIPIFIVGHITKGGTIAGPKILEHIVDSVLYFEGDSFHMHRIIRVEKNRFGSTNEIGVFEMRDSGLIDVPDPSTIFLEESQAREAGTQVVAAMKGSRPIFLEIQSLVSESPFGNPRRLANGVDYNRLLLMLAVLDKKAGLHMNKEDAYVNIAGGLRVDEPAIDLALCISLASSFRNLPVSPRTFAFGEVGLTGEIRAVSQAELRVREGERLGFERCILPKKVGDQLGRIGNLELIGVTAVDEALEYALEG
ncbi:MAG: DNA repair protein RadA [Clostridia bacterium]|nr:DNA repair protein RadA [Clostridia bacterium]